MDATYISPLRHRAFAFLLLLLLSLATLGGMIWRNLHHFDLVLAHVNYSHSVQNVSIELQQALIEYLTESLPFAYPDKLTNTITALNKTIAEMDALIEEDEFVVYKHLECDRNRAGIADRCQLYR